MLFRKGQRILGIEFNDDELRFVEMKKEESRSFLLGYGIEKLPAGLIQDGEIQDEKQFHRFITAFLKKYKPSKRMVNISISHPNIIIRPYQFRNLPEKILRKALEMEIANNLQLPFSDFIFDYVPVPGKEGTNAAVEGMINLLLVIAPKQTIERYVRLLKRSGMRIRSVDLTSLAVFRYFSITETSLRDSLLIILLLYKQKVEIHLFNQGLLRISRSLPLVQEVNSEAEHEAPLLTFTTYEQSILREVERILNFYTYTLNHRDQKLQHIILSGENPFYTALFTYLAEQLGVPVLEPKSSFIFVKNRRKNRRIDMDLPRMAAAFGLAYKEVTRHGD